MEIRQLIRSGFAASAIAHLSAIAAVLVFADVHPFGSVTAEPIAVDIVSPEEVVQSPKPPEAVPEPKATETFGLGSKADAPSPPQSAAPSASVAPSSATPQKQAALSPPVPARQQPAPQPPVAQAQPAAQAPPAAQPPQPAAPPSPAYKPPEPDITLKYHVMLGLPPQVPPVQPQDKPGDGYDAPAIKAADLESSLVTEFRRHLKSCSKLPGTVSASDEIEIKLRVSMTPDGRLAAAPVPIGVRHPSENGPALLHSAVAALEACQPYTMLPAERYGEWKVLDLTFTPRDFAGAS